jgi:PEGA domain
LRPGQHAALLNLLHDVPPGVKIVDNIGDDSSAPVASSSAPAAPKPTGAVSPVPSSASAPPSNAPAPQSASSETPKVTGSRVAWADVKSWPTGAEIYVDDFPTGQKTPARVQVSSGVHMFTLTLEGFKDLRRGVEVSDGGTVEVQGQLRRH